MIQKSNNNAPGVSRQLLKLKAMGAINYGTSELFCNLGYNLNNDVADYEEAQNDQSWTYDEVQDYIDELTLYYYDIHIKPGYYEGFYLDISDIDGDYYADDEDKQERVKELHKIGRALIDIANKFGLVSYAPGWSTGHANTGDTIRAIKKAVKKEITEIYNTTKE